MTFLEIEAFLKIAQCGSFSAAAEKLYITQPALSLPDPLHWRKNWAIPCLSGIKESVMWS